MPSSKDRVADPASRAEKHALPHIAAGPHAPDDVQRELEAVLESSEFRGSHRGRLLLRYMVENALKGGSERLKERTIGVELFHREASYDTGQDAIVRVAANDVRKRLAAHYQNSDPAASKSKIRISLAPGSYVPDFEPPEGSAGAAGEGMAVSLVPVRPAWRGWAPWVIVAGLAAACTLLVNQNMELRSAQTRVAPLAILPWSELAASGASITLIPADVNFAFYKSVVHADQPLTVYTGQPWLEGIANRVPSISDLSRMTLTSIADAAIAARIGGVLRHGGCSISVRSGRTTQVGDFKSDRSVILLGSAYANPWVGLMNDHLNFRIEYDPVLAKQVCMNASPRPGESSTYVGTAHTPEPGIAYATISLVPNLSGDGFVMIIAGTNMEGTEAAGELVTDLPRLASVLRSQGIAPTAKVRQLELLMRVNHMNSQSSRSEIIAHRVNP